MTTPFLFVPTFSWPAAPGGLLYTYAAGGTTPQTTYSDAAGAVPNANPVVLDANGSSTIRLGAGAYHFVLKDSTGATTLWDQDNYPGSNTLATVLGMDATGVADSSTALQNALNSSSIVILPPPNAGKQYIVHDVTIPGGTTLFAEGAFFVDKAGANFVFKLTGFAAKLVGGYISSATNCAQAALIVDDGNVCEIRGTRVFNATTVVKLQSSSNGANGFGCSRTQLTNIEGIAYSVCGLDSGPNVHDTQALNVYMDCNTVAGGGGQIPKVGVLGFRFVGTGSTVAFGGHQYTNCNAINMQTGWTLTDTNLIKLTNCIADTLSGVGFLLNGSTNACDLDSCFAGTCAAPIVAAGTSVNNMVRSLRTYGTGQIPSFGGTTWYSSAGFAAPFYEITQQATAKITVDLDDWQASNGSNAHYINEAVALNINLIGGIRIPFNSNTTVAAGSTVYLGPNAQSATEDPQKVNLPSAVVAHASRCIFLCNTAPGAGQSFTYTLRANGADTAITGTTSGAGVFQSTNSGGPVGINSGIDVSVKLVTSGSAALAVHRGYLLLIPQPT